MIYKTIGLIAIVLGSIGLGASLSKANIFDDIKVAVTGHVKDAQGRIFGEHMVVSGEMYRHGTFDEDADGQDAVHWAEGSVRQVWKDTTRYVQLERDFESGPAPDAHVFVSASYDIDNEDDFNSTVQIDLGPLKLGKGASYYELPKGMIINSVTIWCLQFGEYIGSADFNKV